MVGWTSGSNDDMLKVTSVLFPTISEVARRTSFTALCTGAWFTARGASPSWAILKKSGVSACPTESWLDGTPETQSPNLVNDIESSVGRLGSSSWQKNLRAREVNCKTSHTKNENIEPTAHSNEMSRTREVKHCPTKSVSTLRQRSNCDVPQTQASKVTFSQ